MGRRGRTSKAARIAGVLAPLLQLSPPLSPRAAPATLAAAVATAVAKAVVTPAPSQLLTPGCPALGFHVVIAQDTYYLKIHVQIHQINVGIWYKNPIYYQARATKHAFNHGNPGSLLSPIHVYLLRSFFLARRTFMGIKYVLPNSRTPISASAAMDNY